MSGTMSLKPSVYALHPGSDKTPPSLYDTESDDDTPLSMDNTPPGLYDTESDDDAPMGMDNTPPGLYDTESDDENLPVEDKTLHGIYDTGRNGVTPPVTTKTFKDVLTGKWTGKCLLDDAPPSGTDSPVTGPLKRKFCEVQSYRGICKSRRLLP
jgi:hypothetical protein